MWSFVGQGINCLQQGLVGKIILSGILFFLPAVDLLISRKSPEECARHVMLKQSFSLFLYSWGDWLISLRIYQSNFLCPPSWNFISTCEVGVVCIEYKFNFDFKIGTNSPSEQKSSLTDRPSSFPLPSASDPFQFPSLQLNNFIFHSNAFIHLSRDYISQAVHVLQLIFFF